MKNNEVFHDNDGDSITSNRLKGLCHRCEYRAKYYETGMHPRYECAKGNVGACYMYLPVRPIITEKEKGDNRPRLAGPMLSSRERLKRVADDKDVELAFEWTNKNKIMLYWKPKK